MILNRIFKDREALKKMRIDIELLDKSETAQDVKKCLTVLLGTRAGSLAMDRDFGLTWDFLDMNTKQAERAIEQEVLAKVAKYEPRAIIERITFSSDTNGRLIPKLEVSINYE